MGTKNTPDNEVARLRELLDRAIEIAKITTEYIEDSDRRKHYRSEIQQLAPAPEEPVNPTCANTTHKFSHCDCHRRERMVCDKCQKTDEPAPEWRELAPDEVICEGDEAKSKATQEAIWKKVNEYEIGKYPCTPLYIYRTRRPLPKREEMPLEDEPLDQFQYHLMLCEDAGESGDLLQCLRYLRDEVKKLKAR